MGGLSRAFQPLTVAGAALEASSRRLQHLSCWPHEDGNNILVKYVIDSCVLCVDNNKTKSIEIVLLVKVWLTKNMSSN